jgi:hypothetical protein
MKTMKRKMLLQSENSFPKGMWLNAVNMRGKVGYKLIWRLK